METSRLFYREGKSDKVYEAILDGGTVTFRWGRRGSTMQEDVKVLHAGAARQLYDKKIREKLDKGYRFHFQDGVGYSNSHISPPTRSPSPPPPPTFYPQPIQPVRTLPLRTPPATRQPIQPIQAPVVTRRIRPNTSLAQPLSAYQPMLLNAITPEEAESLMDNPQWFLQQKADGVRCVAMIDRPNVETASRTSKPVHLTDEIKRELLLCFQVRSVIDMEVTGESVVIFDILFNGAGDMRSWSCERRLAHLDEAGARAKQMQLSTLSFIQTARTTAEKRAALVLLQRVGAEGIVLKDKTSPYSAGRPNSLGPARKWKFTASATVMVTGHNKQGKRSVDIAVLDENAQLVSVGSVSVPDKHGPLPPPGTLVECRYLYAYRQGSLVQPAYAGIRTDKLVVDGLASLQYRGEERE